MSAPGARSWGVLWAVVGVALLGGVAWSEDPPPDPLVTKVAEFEARVAEHVKDKAVSALLLDAGEASTLHKEVASRPELKKRVLSVFSTLLKSVKEDKEKQTVLEALGSTADPEAASIVKPLLRQPNVKEADSLLMSAIAVAGRVPGKETVEPLLKIVDSSKHMPSAIAAMKSLGNFGKVKPHRVKILSTLVDIVQPLKPGGRPGMRGGSGGIGDDSGPANYPAPGSPAARWGAFAPVLPDTLNSLTGQKVTGVEQWFQMVNEAKPNFDRLFTDS
jgi:hypothetical protein